MVKRLRQDARGHVRDTRHREDFHAHVARRNRFWNGRHADGVRADGPQVAAVANDVVQMRKITLGRDLGTQIEVLAGLNEKELIVTNPTDAMRDGFAVKAALAPPPDKPADKPAEKPAPKAESPAASPSQVAGKVK